MVLPDSDVHSCLDMQGAHLSSINVANIEDLELLMIHESKMFEHMTGLQKEKQISVDPVSLKEPCNIDMILPAIVPTKSNLVLPLPPEKPLFLSTSLTNSASSSPRFSSNMLKKKWKKQNQASPLSLARQHSVALANLERLRGSRMQRSKSCCEGRTSSASDEFGVWLSKGSSNGHEGSSLNKIETKNEVLMNDMEAMDKKFKCGALCLFFPGFGKGKAVKARKEENGAGPVISRTVSLEKFECGSWTSSAIINGIDDNRDCSNLFFDLPLELIRSSANDADSPVRAAFLFDKDRKGVLKHSSSRGEVVRKSKELPRDVRFSTSSPRSNPVSPASCITPRLRKAREDFNAFLEAQSA